MAAVQDDLLDVLVIGGGWSGMLACKYAMEQNLSVRVLEKRDNIGGVWYFTHDSKITSVMQSTRTSSSSTTTEMSDFPMPKKIGEFPKHDDVYKYLKDYYEHFKLGKHFKFNCTVRQVKKFEEMWNVETEDGELYRSKNLAVCTGIHQKPDLSMKTDILKDFTGTIHHSGEFKEFYEPHRGKRILMIGGGETASDIVDAWHTNCDKIVWCIPRGQHFFRKFAKLLPHRKPQALDKASSRAMKLLCPFTKSKPGVAWVCRWTTGGSLLAYQGHGIPEFRNNAPFFRAFINKHAHVLDFIDYEHVIPKGAISSVIGNQISFMDGESIEVDSIILCSGYITEFPFMPRTLRDIPLTDNYKFVFNPHDPSLAYLGFVRPVIGSIPGITEMQAQWVAKVWNKRIQLVDEADRVIAVRNDKMFWSEYFQSTSRRVQTLVEGYTYLDDVARLSNVYPDYWSLFKRNPRGFFTAYFAPYNGCCWRLNEPEMEQKALALLASHSQNLSSPFAIFLNIFLRLIWFDWFLDKLSAVKYFFQTNWLARKVSKTRFVRALDYIWTTPKRLLFDNESVH